MLFTNFTQFAVLALMLFIGWVFGLASHPGGKKWKKAYREEQEARASDVKDRDTTIRDNEATIRDLETRNASLTTDLSKAREATPVAAPAPVAAPVATPATADTAASAAAPAFAGRARDRDDQDRDDRVGGDDLTRLRGVDRELAGLFADAGVARYADLAALSDQDELALERRIDLPAGFIARERLREQARLLADGRADDHARAFG